MSEKCDEPPSSTFNAALAVFDLRLVNLANRVTTLENHVDRLEAHRSDQVAQLREMHRDLRAVQSDLHRLIDDRVPLKLLLERAVGASERAEKHASDACLSNGEMFAKLRGHCRALDESNEDTRGNEGTGGDEDGRGKP